jgi:glutaredoxin
MNMANIEIFTTSECPKCVKLMEFLKAGNIDYDKRMIDSDPDAETDALMLNIIAAPALKVGGVVLKAKDIFTKEGEISEKVKSLLKRSE